ncbi:MAG: hypothetical protein IT378_18735, partial [Sandaracinaceae bacterium]|nr:hypothetical protein [Sandaracinaceae bacterium]
PADATAALDAAAPGCGCTTGPHGARIFVLSDDGELWSYDPIADVFELVVGPVCATTERPFSMAVDPHGVAWILYSQTRRIQRFDLVRPGPCTDSGYLPTHASFPLFGMAFVIDPATECASLYAHSYDGEGPFGEGAAIGSLGVIEGEPPRMRALGPIDYDGGELSGTRDGRLFAFTGVMPAKLVEYDRATGARISILPLEGFSKTNASAFAFFGGDLYLFTEALPTECGACFDVECAAAWQVCQADAICNEQIACAIDGGRVTDACGGGAGAEMLACLGRCSSACLISSRARVSQVSRVDWDRSDGPEQALTVIRRDAPVRIVGAGTSPCVPTVPF